MTFHHILRLGRGLGKSTDLLRTGSSLTYLISSTIECLRVMLLYLNADGKISACTLAVEAVVG
jgi:hypothetical protein